MKSYFITFEGVEGSGKSTQIRFCKNYLRKLGKRVLLVREPGSTKIGEQIRHVLLHPKNDKMSVETELFLFLAARAQLVSEVIRPALQKGMVVISDRYEDSTIAYQGYGGGFPLPQLKQIAQAARGNVTPNLTFLLDIDSEKGLKRAGRNDRIEKKALGFHKKVRRGFLALAKANPKRFVVISSRLSKSEVQKKIKEQLDHVF